MKYKIQINLFLVLAAAALLFCPAISAGGFTSSGQWSPLAQPPGIKLIMLDNFGHKREMLFESAGNDLLPLGQTDSSKKVLFKRR